MKTVKDIYDFFHQFPDKDKNSASLMEFLETIPGFSETEIGRASCRERV